MAYYHEKKRKIAKKLVQAKDAFNKRKLYYEQNPNMKGYMDTYKPMITFLEEQDQYIKTVEKLPVIKYVQQKYPSTPSIVSQLEIESLIDKMSEYFNHYEGEAKQNLEEGQDVLGHHLNSCQTEKQRELTMKAHLIYEKRLNKKNEILSENDRGAKEK